MHWITFCKGVIFPVIIQPIHEFSPLPKEALCIVPTILFSMCILKLQIYLLYMFLKYPFYQSTGMMSSFASPSCTCRDYVLTVLLLHKDTMLWNRKGDITLSRHFDFLMIRNVFFELLYGSLDYSDTDLCSTKQKMQKQRRDLKFGHYFSSSCQKFKLLFQISQLFVSVVDFWFVCLL